MFKNAIVEFLIRWTITENDLMFLCNNIPDKFKPVVKSQYSHISSLFNEVSILDLTEVPYYIFEIKYIS